MKILILGGAGMVGQKLVRHLASNPPVDVVIDEIILCDIFEPAVPDAPFKISTQTGNCAEEAEARKLAGLRADVIYNLAAIVSGEAEKNFEKGWDINARGGWYLLEGLRAEHNASGGEYVPKLIFTSSIAVFGPPYPDKIDDDFLCAPQGSYGAQKAMTELLVADYARKGFIDGFSLRLPTICVRPGKANLAASSFFSGIIREPLHGMEALLPVPDTVRHWHASPRSAAGFLAHALTLDTKRLNGRRSLNLPGVSCTVAEQIEALRKIAGEDAVKLIKPKPDADIMMLVSGWPQNFAPEKAVELGFKAEQSFEEIIKIYIQDDLNV